MTGSRCASPRKAEALPLGPDRALAEEALLAFTGARARPIHAAVASSGAGRVTALAGDPHEAQSAAAAIAGAIARLAQDGPADDAAFDALAPAVRAAQALLRSGRIAGAVVTVHGRGRAIGPLDVDMLLRHGVSRWR